MNKCCKFSNRNRHARFLEKFSEVMSVEQEIRAIRKLKISAELLCELLLERAKVRLEYGKICAGERIEGSGYIFFRLEAVVADEIKSWFLLYPLTESNLLHV